MKKLKLELDDLAVASFITTNLIDRRGTLIGRDSDEEEIPDDGETADDAYLPTFRCTRRCTYLNSMCQNMTCPSL